MVKIKDILFLSLLSKIGFIIFIVFVQLNFNAKNDLLRFLREIVYIIVNLFKFIEIFYTMWRITRI